MFDATVTTTCGYCGVGCRLEAHARDGKIVAIGPALDGSANGGHTCARGAFHSPTPAPRPTSAAVDVRPIGEEATMKPAMASA